MAIIQGIITVRLGKESELNTSKLLSGEFGFTTDTKKLFIGTSSGAKEIAFQGEVSGSVTDEQIQEAVNKYLEENPIVSSDLYMRVDSGYIQFSQDNENWENVISVEELTGPRGVGVGDVVQTGTSNEPDGVNEITILMTDGETKKFYVKNGSSGSDGVGIEKIEQTFITNEPGDENEITVTLTDGREERFYVYNGKAGVNGAKGETGVGISTVKQTTTSTEDDGKNFITVTKTDGSTSTFSVKNGSKGSTGEKGEKGDKGDKGDTGAAGKDGSDASVTTANIKTALGYTPAKQTDVDNLSQEIGNYLPKNQGASNVGKILVVGTDGNLVLTDMPEGGASGDVTGVLDDSNNILLSGNLADGTYTLKYLNEDGTYTDIGTLEVGGILKVTSIGATKTKTSYFEGDTLNTDDITVTATYSDGSTAIVTDYTVDSSTVQMDTAGSYNLVISYGGVSTTIGITVSVYQIINLAKPNPTNTTDISIWCNDARLGSDGSYRSNSGTVVTNYIPCTGGVVYVKGMSISLTSTAMTNSISFWDDSKNLLSISAIIDYTKYDYMDASQSDNGVYTFDLANVHNSDNLKEFAYVRLVGSLTGTLDDVVITVNQPIE